MTWYEIIVGLIGVIGGSSGVISLYNAKANKQTIDIGNMSSMLDEAHKMFDEMKEDRDGIKQQFDEYKKETMTYVADFKARFAKLETRLDSAEGDVLNLKRSIYQGYRCKYPEKIEDCPVLKEYEKFKCNICDNKE